MIVQSLICIFLFFFKIHAFANLDSIKKCPYFKDDDFTAILKNIVSQDPQEGPRSCADAAQNLQPQSTNLDNSEEDPTNSFKGYDCNDFQDKIRNEKELYLALAKTIKSESTRRDQLYKEILGLLEESSDPRAPADPNPYSVCAPKNLESCIRSYSKNKEKIIRSGCNNLKRLEEKKDQSTKRKRANEDLEKAIEKLFTNCKIGPEYALVASGVALKYLGLHADSDAEFIFQKLEGLVSFLGDQVQGKTDHQLVEDVQNKISDEQKKRMLSCTFWALENTYLNCHTNEPKNEYCFYEKASSEKNLESISSIFENLKKSDENTLDLNSFILSLDHPVADPFQSSRKNIKTKLDWLQDFSELLERSKNKKEVSGFLMVVFPQKNDLTNFQKMISSINECKKRLDESDYDQRFTALESDTCKVITSQLTSYSNLHPIQPLLENPQILFHLGSNDPIWSQNSFENQKNLKSPFNPNYNSQTKKVLENFYENFKSNFQEEYSKLSNELEKSLNSFKKDKNNSEILKGNILQMLQFCSSVVSIAPEFEGPNRNDAIEFIGSTPNATESFCSKLLCLPKNYKSFLEANSNLWLQQSCTSKINSLLPGEKFVLELFQSENPTQIRCSENDWRNL